MARPKSIPLEWRRLNAQLPADLLRHLHVLSAMKGINLSILLSELLRKHLPRALKEEGSAPPGTHSGTTEPSVSPSGIDPKVFPANWDGDDLKERLAGIGLSQKKACKMLSIDFRTFNHWACHVVPKKHRPRLQSFFQSAVATSPDSSSSKS